MPFYNWSVACACLAFYHLDTVNDTSSLALSICCNICNIWSHVLLLFSPLELEPLHVQPESSGFAFYFISFGKICFQQTCFVHLKLFEWMHWFYFSCMLFKHLPVPILTFISWIAGWNQRCKKRQKNLCYSFQGCANFLIMHGQELWALSILCY